MTLNNKTKPHHSGRMLDVHFVPQTGSNPHLGSSSEAVFSEASRCIVSSVLVLSAVPPEGQCVLFSLPSEDHRTRCTGTLPVLEDKIAWNSWILDSTGTQTIVVGSQNTSHTHSGSTGHMWWDCQSFQVINP